MADMESARQIVKRLRAEFFEGRADHLQDAQDIRQTLFDHERGEGTLLDLVELIITHVQGGGADNVADVRTNDPLDPVEGQWWVRKDLSPPQLRYVVDGRKQVEDLTLLASSARVHVPHDGTTPNSYASDTTVGVIVQPRGLRSTLTGVRWLAGGGGDVVAYVSAPGGDEITSEQVVSGNPPMTINFAVPLELVPGTSYEIGIREESPDGEEFTGWTFSGARNPVDTEWLDVTSSVVVNGGVRSINSGRFGAFDLRYNAQ